MSEWVWMKNEATRGVARFPVGVQESWAARGWVECPEPTEEDQLSDTVDTEDTQPLGVQEDPEPETETELETAPEPEPEPPVMPATTRGQSKKENTSNG